MKNDSVFNMYFMLGGTAIGSFILSLILIPGVKLVAINYGLIDKPNHRKLHALPVPMAGGISICLTAIVVLLINPMFPNFWQNNLPWIFASLIILVVGVIDDRFDVKPVYRLIIQLACAALVAFSGIRIVSFYGFMGVDNIPVVLQYGITMVVITGVVNAYNLMDGIDGLVGGLSIVASAVLGIIALQFHQYDLVVIFAAFIGALFGFLKYNLSRKKIFMGDAGSLFLGFIFVVVAIRLLNVARAHDSTEVFKVLLFIVGVFLVPVLDSLRVYRGRIKKGISPFKADRTHLHHLFLYLGLTHKRATVLIIFLTALIIGIVSSLLYLIPAVWVIVVSVVFFIGITSFLTTNMEVQRWREHIRKLERN